MNTKTSPEEVVISDGENIICGCTSTSLAALRRRIADDVGIAFEDLLAETGAGAQCTACLLDLEYHYVEAQAGLGARPVAAGAAKRTKPDAQAAMSAKQRLFQWLDRVSPSVAYPFDNTVPVLYGPGIEQWIWITNRSMMFEGERCAPMIRMEVIIRDQAGRIVKTERKDVEPESTWRYEMSGALAKNLPPPPAGQIGYGTVQILRRGLSSGIRGTTRPQIEIITPKAACAVHSQALTGRGRYWFACLYRPDEERMMFSVINGADHEATIELSYPIDIPSIEPLVHHITLPARGTTLHELKLPPDIMQKIKGTPITLTWHAYGLHKLWALCGTPNLDRLSIDHL